MSDEIDPPTPLPPEDADAASAAPEPVVEQVRAKIAREQMSLAKAAMTIGVSYPALLDVVDGRPPTGKRLVKFTTWLARPAPTEPTTEGATEPVAEPASGETSAPASAPADSTDAPRRRGRPAKVEASAAAASSTDSGETPRRRGRPPKAVEAQTAPKRRGRPPKATGVKAAKAPKSRGRPAKEAAAAPAKRRGRPPKMRAKGDAPAKQRGRPPKAASGASTTGAPKRRGRPPASTAAVMHALGGALREIVTLADDALAIAVHRAGREFRAAVERMLAGKGT